jgi:hypothetical protein
VVRGSRLWTRLRAAEARMPGALPCREIRGIVRQTIDGRDEAGNLLISEVSFRPCPGYEHLAPAIEIFEPPIKESELPARWRKPDNLDKPTFTDQASLFAT